jgi:hypothetical protein
VAYIACVDGPQIKDPDFSLSDLFEIRQEPVTTEPTALQISVSGLKRMQIVGRSRDGILRINDNRHRMAMRYGRDGPKSGAFLQDGTDA